jgi:hypothetical protein
MCSAIPRLPEGDGTYVLSEKIKGKPVFKASVVSGLATKEYIMQYNNSFLEWQIYERYAAVDTSGKALPAGKYPCCKRGSCFCNSCLT